MVQSSYAPKALGGSAERRQTVRKTIVQTENIGSENSQTNNEGHSLVQTAWSLIFKATPSTVR